MEIFLPLPRNLVQIDGAYGLLLPTRYNEAGDGLWCILWVERG